MAAAVGTFLDEPYISNIHRYHPRPEKRHLKTARLLILQISCGSLQRGFLPLNLERKNACTREPGTPLFVGSNDVGEIHSPRTHNLETRELRPNHPRFVCFVAWKYTTYLVLRRMILLLGKQHLVRYHVYIPIQVYGCGDVRTVAVGVNITINTGMRISW